MEKEEEREREVKSVKEAFEAPEPAEKDAPAGNPEGLDGVRPRDILSCRRFPHLCRSTFASVVCFS